MTNDTRQRAYEALFHKVGGSQDRPEYFPRIFVVGDKLFFFELPAIRWCKEATGNHEQIETVTIEEAMKAMPSRAFRITKSKISQRGTFYEWEREANFPHLTQV